MDARDPCTGPHWPATHNRNHFGIICNDSSLNAMGGTSRPYKVHRRAYLLNRFIRLTLGIALVTLIGLVSDADADTDNRASQDNRLSPAEVAALRALKSGPIELPLAGQCVLNLPEGYLFIPRNESVGLIRTEMPHFDASALLGMIIDTNGDTQVMLQYLPVGHLDDKDLLKLNAKKLLKEIREASEARNEHNTDPGKAQLTVVGWAETPYYDRTAHTLALALQFHDQNARPGADDGIMYHALTLGREGILWLLIPTNASSLPKDRTVIQELLGGLSFDPGKRYQDFNAATDRHAELDTAKLIWNMDGVHAGVAAGLGLLFLKSWKFIIMGLVGMIVAIGRYIGRSNRLS